MINDERTKMLRQILIWGFKVEFSYDLPENEIGIIIKRRDANKHKSYWGSSISEVVDEAYTDLLLQQPVLRGGGEVG